LASAFGWSKPNIGTAAGVIARRNLFHMTNVDGQSQATAFGLHADSRVSTSNKLFGTDEDEMSFAFLKRIPAYITQFTISDTAGVGT
jgi:hypothetical protein